MATSKVTVISGWLQVFFASSISNYGKQAEQLFKSLKPAFTLVKIRMLRSDLIYLLKTPNPMSDFISRSCPMWFNEVQQEAEQTDCQTLRYKFLEKVSESMYQDSLQPVVF